MATGRRENPLLARADMVATGVLPDAGVRISAVRTGRLAEARSRRLISPSDMSRGIA